MKLKRNTIVQHVVNSYYVGRISKVLPNDYYEIVGFGRQAIYDKTEFTICENPDFGFLRGREPNNIDGKKVVRSYLPTLKKLKIIDGLRYDYQPHPSQFPETKILHITTADYFYTMLPCVQVRNRFHFYGKLFKADGIAYRHIVEFYGMKIMLETPRYRKKLPRIYGEKWGIEYDYHRRTVHLIYGDENEMQHLMMLYALGR